MAVLLVAGGLTGCGRALYLVRSGVAEARILWRREPIAALLARSDLDRDLRRSLELAEDVRRFGRATLRLDAGESFTTYTAIDADETIWVLSAAHRDRLEAYTWWWPVVGRVPYQGFFERGAAERAAARLARRALDVDVRPASAFSTLGWFADPLLSTTAEAPPVVLAETILHELFHATLYLPGETSFNESAATFVGNRGTIAYFCTAVPDPARCAEARVRWERLRAHGRILARYAARLRALYARDEAPARAEATRRVLAAAAARALVRRGVGSGDEVAPPNNARLLGMLAYETELDAFDGLAPSSGALPDAIAGLVARARGAHDPFDAVRTRLVERPACRYCAIDERVVSPTGGVAGFRGTAAADCGRARTRGYATSA